MDLLGQFKKWLWGDKSPFSTYTVPVESLPGTGALLDTRTAIQKQVDVHFGEIVAGAALVEWVTRAPNTWRKFVAFNQASSNACVAFSMAKILGIMRWLKDRDFVAFSGGDIYRRRPNKPGTGMDGQAPYAIASQGVTLDAILPSQGMNDEAIDHLLIPDYVSQVASLFAIQNPQPIVLTAGNIDEIASVIQTTGKAVMVWFFFTSREWGYPGSADFNVPQALDGVQTPVSEGALRHSVAAVDFTLYNGEKALIIEDSAWFGGYNRRVVTESFLKLRNFYAAYPMNFKQERVVNTMPVYLFTKSLSFIPWDDVRQAPADPVLNAAQMVDVKALQIILQRMTDVTGKTYFPTNVVATGYYGALTAQAVYAWGMDHLLARVPKATVNALAGKLFGEASVAEMNAELV